MVKAIWNDEVVAESDETVVMEGNHYFPKTSIHSQFFKESPTTSFCPWKGTSHYFSLDVNGQQNVDAAWYYPDPKPEAAEITGRVAFWKGVELVD